MSDLPPTWVRWPYARIRRDLETERGEVVYFVVQLEYDVEATPSGQHSPDWRTVARFDHNRAAFRGHDIAEEGLHLDIYRDGKKHKVLTDFPPVELDSAFDVCEQYLIRRAERLLAQFEVWHDLYGPWRTYSPE